MTEAIAEGNSSAADQWRERIAEQHRNGASIKKFCKERGLSECSFLRNRSDSRADLGDTRITLGANISMSDSK
jgi:hypothetical protein